MDNKYSIKLKKGLKLRKLGSKYMIVDSADGSDNLRTVYSLNETAAWIWRNVEKGEHTTPENLASLMCEEYDVSREKVLEDIAKQLSEWVEMGIAVKENILSAN